ncbi:DUF4363 family protein [Clostridium fallax]|uniref:Uncharacterized protein n=1 Tax=Clostridium fallax TaxID=1533 RepID=A0A1M4SU28_9CLOT|nr:DUF4363 family protein [Clostridium fallax]SHE35678.1 protein of unknown function [Clostridium fallax]SQB07971.1 Uncharacterised protein [Clostridium fallax]
MLGFIIYSHINLTNTCNKIINICDNIEDDIQQNKKSDGIKNSIALKDYIQNSYSLLTAYLNHADLDNILIETIKLSEYIEYDNESDIFATLHAIKHSTSTIRKLQKPTLNNIF